MRVAHLGAMFSKRGGAEDQPIEEAIIEYLRHRRFDATAECLHSERKNKRVLGKSSVSHSPAESQASSISLHPS